MSNSPLISVITVVFNDEKHIGKTIESVLNQSYEAIEHIVVDGKSTDGTLRIIESYKGVSKVISEPDQGLYDAMNKGLKMATGDYVWFLNAGDRIYERDTVEKMMDGLEEWPDIIYGGTMIIDEDQQEIGDRRLKPPEQLTWRSFRKGMLVCHQSLIVKRDLAPDYDLQYRLSADIDWSIRAAKKSGQIHNSHLVLSRFLEGGLTDQNIKAGLKERFRIMARYYGWVPTLFRHFLFGIRLTGFYLRHRRI